MRLVRFSFKDGGMWNLKKVSLGNINLIVGPNAVGKTRSIKAIDTVVHFMLKVPELFDPSTFECGLSFIDGESSIHYNFNVKDKSILSEMLSVDNTLVIKRDTRSSIIENELINPPDGMLITQVIRDTQKYPVIERIMEWAEHTYGIAFSSVRPSYKNLGGEASKLFNNVLPLPEMYEKISEVNKDDIRTIMCKMDYDIEKIGLVPLPQKNKLVFLSENGVNMPLFSFSLSNGMFRVFYTLVYVFYLSKITGEKCLLIDDLGEGLDYHRSTKLGEWLFKHCEDNNIQLIVTSNDNVLMNHVDLKYWIILSRNGSDVDAINEASDHDLFRQFRLTGLENFDIFSTDFISQYRANKGGN